MTLTVIVRDIPSWPSSFSAYMPVPHSNETFPQSVVPLRRLEVPESGPESTMIGNKRLPYAIALCERPEGTSWPPKNAARFSAPRSYSSCMRLTVAETRHSKRRF